MAPATTALGGCDRRCLAQSDAGFGRGGSAIRKGLDQILSIYGDLIITPSHEEWQTFARLSAVPELRRLCHGKNKKNLPRTGADVFLAIQAVFLVWLIAGIATTGHSGADAHTQAVQWCSSKANWQYLYTSQADCVTHYGNGLNDASDVGKGIGVGIVIALWVAVDFFLGLGYGIYRLASRR